VNASRAALDRYGLLLLSDNALPAHAQLVAGGPIAGSWWGHPDGKRIFNSAEALEAAPDVTTAKLINGKVTFIHARLWPALVGVAMARDLWQTKGLSADAIAILDRVDRDGSFASDDASLGMDGKRRTAAIRKLEERLLVAAVDEHTARGSHRTVLFGWAPWALAREIVADDDGKRILDEAAASLGETARLPWQRSAR
jgi:hypothetical protein